MTTPKKETVFLVSCYDLQAHALRRQARAWRQARYAVELLFFKRPGLIPFSHQEANLLAQEVRQAAPGAWDCLPRKRTICSRCFAFSVRRSRKRPST